MASGKLIDRIIALCRLLPLSMEVICPSSTVTSGYSTISFPRKSRRAVIVLVISVLPLRKDIATEDCH